ncbi:MAG: hypothetical protein SGPRY_011222, partial [Prymnesium sp.]
MRCLAPHLAPTRKPPSSPVVVWEECSEKEVVHTARPFLVNKHRATRIAERSAAAVAVAEEAVEAAAARAAVERVADLVVAEWEENMDRGDLEVAWEAKRVAWFGCGVQILQQ